MDPDERAWWIERHTRSQGMCPMHNGPRSDCTDEHKPWFPFRSICHAEMEQKAADARYDEIHETLQFHDGTFKKWAAKRSEAFPYHYRDGVVIGVAPAEVNPDDDFLSPPGTVQVPKEAAEAGDGHHHRPGEGDAR